MDATVMDHQTDQRRRGGGKGYAIGIERIQQMLPHRFPMLMIDRIAELVLDQSAIGIKNFTINEAFFQGHFPNHPIVPGVMLIECMAQTASMLVLETLGEAANGKVVYFMFIDNAKFRRPVTPGDQLQIHVLKQRRRGNIWKFAAVAKVDGVVAAEATYAAMIVNPTELPSHPE
ncbi:MAG: 3-hydroxyacyl-ACP dehydratase FabZ [Acetobacteraceae bacterium]